MDKWFMFFPYLHFKYKSDIIEEMFYKWFLLAKKVLEVFFLLYL